MVAATLYNWSRVVNIAVLQLSTAISIAILFSIATGIAILVACLVLHCGITILLELKYCNTWKQFFGVKYTLNREDAV